MRKLKIYEDRDLICFSLYYLSFGDIFNTRRWNSTKDLQDPELQRLASLLPAYCLKSKADNTTTKYRYAFNHFSTWCSSHSNESSKLCHLTASDMTVSLYLIHLSQTYSSNSKIEEAVCAISWAHNIAGYDNPCLSTLVKSCKEGAIRETSRPVQKKEPLLPEHLLLLTEKYGKSSNCLSDIRLLTLCLLGFAGFLRFSEIVNIRRSHITFHSDHVSLFIARSKTDKYNQGSHVCIAKTGTQTCPVNMLSRYLQMAGIISTSDEYIFRQITFLKKSNSYKLRDVTKPLSYTRAREIILAGLEGIGLDKSKFGIHSLRRGGATAACAAGISDRVFKKHGRWKSDNAKDGYVKESLNEKLSVSLNLGI